MKLIKLTPDDLPGGPYTTWRGSDLFINLSHVYLLEKRPTKDGEFNWRVYVGAQDLHAIGVTKEAFEKIRLAVESA